MDSDLTLAQVEGQLLDHYLTHRHVWDRSRPYRRYGLKDMPVGWQRLCQAAGTYSEPLHDLLVVIWRARGQPSGTVPVPIGPDDIREARDYLLASGRQADDRAAIWLTALRALPACMRDYALGAGSHDWLAARKPVRTRNLPSGTFAPLSRDLAIWAADACRPLESVFDMRKPISEAHAAKVTWFFEAAASLLFKSNVVDKEVTLRQLVEQWVFDAWLTLRDDDRPSVTKATIDAFVRIRTDFFGRLDATASHMRRQRRDLCQANTLAPEALEELNALLVRRRMVELTPPALMAIAGSNQLAVPTRLKVANVAAAMQAVIELALRPNDLLDLGHDDDFRLRIKTRLWKAESSPVVQTSTMTRMLRQRQAIRRVLCATESHQLMVNEEGGPMDSKLRAQALSRTQGQFGLISSPWQRYRDFSAARLLLDDPTALCRVADLLEISNPDLVRLRYSAIIPRDHLRFRDGGDRTRP